MNIIRVFFSNVPLINIPQVSDHVRGSHFENLTLEQIRQNPDLYYDFLQFVVGKVHQPNDPAV